VKSHGDPRKNTFRTLPHFPGDPHIHDFDHTRLGLPRRRGSSKKTDHTGKRPQKVW
jgi:hypothetical protein